MELAPRELASAFWRRTLLGPRTGARIVLHEQLRSLLGAGVPVADAVAESARRSRGSRRAALEAVSAEIARGATPGEALLRHPERFTPIEGHLVAAGDRTGRYDQAFADAAAHLERARQDFRRVLHATLYPVFLLHFALCVPACSILAMNSGARTAQVTVALVLVSVWAAAAALLTVHAALSRHPGWGRLLASIPMFGRAARDAAVARAASAAGVLFGAGAPIHDALRAAGDCSGNGWVRADLLRAAERVRAGTQVSDAASEVGAFSADERNLVAAGERSGDLDRMFARVAEMAHDRYDATMKRIAAVLPIVLMAVVGLWVLSMALDVFTRSMRGL